jgi:hypothetical protein
MYLASSQRVESGAYKRLEIELKNMEIFQVFSKTFPSLAGKFPLETLENWKFLRTWK